jgi:hypothetical protein
MFLEQHVQWRYEWDVSSVTSMGDMSLRDATAFNGDISNGTSLKSSAFRDMFIQQPSMAIFPMDVFLVNLYGGIAW